MASNNELGSKPLNPNHVKSLAPNLMKRVKIHRNSDKASAAVSNIHGPLSLSSAEAPRRAINGLKTYKMGSKP